MHYMSDDDCKKSKRNEELYKKLAEVQEEHLKTYDNYYAGKASAEDVIKVQDKLKTIIDEWRSTLTAFRQMKD